MTKNSVIDLTKCQSTSNILDNICSFFEVMENPSEYAVILKIKDFQLNQSQLLSIKSLVSSYGAALTGIETSSLITKQLCENSGIKVFDTINEDFKENSEENFGMLEKNIEQNIEQIFNENPQGTLFSVNSEEKQADEQINEAQTPQEPIKAEENAQEEAQNIQEVLPIKSEVEKEIDNIFGVQTEEIKIENSKSDDKIEENIETFDDIEADESTNEDSKNAEEIKESDENGEDFDVEKKVISVYQKAYDDGEDDDEKVYEEVDFLATATDEPVVCDSSKTMYITQTLRSGQTVEFDGNVLIIGDCHPGSEIRATGDITVWGVLGSIAHAGIKGNREAKIRALKLNAIQLRIADCYSRRPDGTNIPYIVKSSSFTPEEAKIVDNNIVLYKII